MSEMNFIISASSKEYYDSLEKDIDTWWEELEYHGRSDYISTIDNLNIGDTIFMADYRFKVVGLNSNYVKRLQVVDD